MAPPKAGFGKREDRPMPPWLLPDGDGVAPPRRRWVKKRETPPVSSDLPSRKTDASETVRAALVAVRPATPRPSQKAPTAAPRGPTPARQRPSTVAKPVAGFDQAADRTADHVANSASLRPVQSHAIRPVQSHEMSPVQSHEMSLVQSHELRPVQSHEMSPVQSHELRPVQSHEMRNEPTYEPSPLQHPAEEPFDDERPDEPLARARDDEPQFTKSSDEPVTAVGYDERDPGEPRPGNLDNTGGGQPTYDELAYDQPAYDELPPVEEPRRARNKPLRVKRSKPRAHRQARVDYDPGYDPNDEYFDEANSQSAYADGYAPETAIAPAAEPVADFAQQEELFNGSPHGEAAAQGQRRFAIPGWALAALVGVLAIPLLMMTGASSALTGQGRPSTGGFFSEFQKLFETPPLPPCPAGLVRAPDKKCWPVVNKAEPVAIVPAVTTPAAVGSLPVDSAPTGSPTPQARPSVPNSGPARGDANSGGANSGGVNSGDIKSGDIKPSRGTPGSVKASERKSGASNSGAAKKVQTTSARQEGPRSTTATRSTTASRSAEVRPPR